MTGGNRNEFSIAGKIFLLGEYAVLERYPALVATVGPRFRFLQIDSEAPLRFVPDSPAGKLLASAKSRGFKDGGWCFEDPLSGAGGFGASTAQFALLYRALSVELELPLDWKSVWTCYRELTAAASLPPSGADLVAQWLGGVVYFDQQAEEEKSAVVDLWSAMDWSGLLVFSATAIAGRKVATHRHLDQLALQGWLTAELGQLVKDGVGAIRKGDVASFGSVLTKYAERIHEAGLEAQGANEDRAALRPLPGVLGVKGAGALLSDAVIVMMAPGSASDTDDVIRVAQSRGLKLMSRGLPHEKGIEAGGAL